MRKYLKFLVLFAAMFLSTFSYGIAGCTGDRWYFSSYVNEFATGNSFLGTNNTGGGFDGTGFNSNLDSTVNYGTCSVSCYYFAYNTVAMQGNNEWGNYSGGATSFLGAAADGTLVRSDMSGNLFIGDRLNHQWTQISGWIDPNAGSIAVGDRNHIFVSNGYDVFQFLPDSGGWIGLGPTSGYTRLSADNNGNLYGSNNGYFYKWDFGAGQWVHFNADNIVGPPGYWVPDMPGATLTVATFNSYGSVNSGGFYALLNGQIYALGFDWTYYYYFWQPVQQPFYATQISGGANNALIAQGSDGVLYYLQSGGFNGSGFGATWQSLTNSSGTLSIGSATDIYNYASSTDVWRLFPNVSTTTWDYADQTPYSSLGSMSGIVPSLLPDNSNAFTGTSNIYVQRQCDDGTNSIVYSSYHAIPIFAAFNTLNVTSVAYCYNNGTNECDYYTENSCNPNLGPPLLNVYEIYGAPPGMQSFFTVAGCKWDGGVYGTYSCTDSVVIVHSPVHTGPGFCTTQTTIGLIKIF